MNAVMAIANKSLYEAKTPRFRQLMDRLWAHSIATAFAAKLVGQHLKMADVEGLFLMGLTHDIGKTFLLKAFSEEAATRHMEIELVVANIQEAHLGVSGVMLKRWGFNEAFIKAVSQHEKNEFDAGAPREGLVVNLANMITRHIGFSIIDPATIEPVDLRSASLLGTTPETIQKIGEETKVLVRDLAHLF
jgi:putative nucleotidyltransferase with HDIG domain